jgi:hypothetical protein
MAQLADFKQDVDGPLAAYHGIVFVHTQDASLQRINAATGALLPPVPLKVN